MNCLLIFHGLLIGFLGILPVVGYAQPVGGIITQPNGLSGIKNSGFGDSSKAKVGKSPEFMKLDDRKAQIARFKSISDDRVKLLASQKSIAKRLTESSDKGDRFGEDIAHVGMMLKGTYSLTRLSAEAKWKDRVIVRDSSGRKLAEIYNKGGDTVKLFKLDEDTEVNITFETEHNGWHQVFAIISANDKAAFFSVEDSSDEDYDDLIVGLKQE